MTATQRAVLRDASGAAGNPNRADDQTQKERRAAWHPAVLSLLTCHDPPLTLLLFLRTLLCWGRRCQRFRMPVHRCCYCCRQPRLP